MSHHISHSFILLQRNRKNMSHSLSHLTFFYTPAKKQKNVCSPESLRRTAQSLTARTRGAGDAAPSSRSRRTASQSANDSSSPPIKLLRKTTLRQIFSHAQRPPSFILISDLLPVYTDNLASDLDICDFLFAKQLRLLLALSLQYYKYFIYVFTLSN